MPPIDPAVVRARAAQVAGQFSSPAICARLIRSLLSDYSDRTHRASQPLAAQSPTRTYKTPAPVVRLLLTALRGPASTSPQAALNLLPEIWAGGSYEEARLAAELLGCVALAAPGPALALIETWLPALDNAEVAQALALHGLAPLAATDPDACLNHARHWMRRSHKWTRCFALAALVPLARAKAWDDVPGALEVVRPAVDDLEPEVRRAAVEALAALLPKSPPEVNQFLREQAARVSHNAHLLVRAILPRLTPADQAALVRLMRA